jgi:diaminohydroxyphosphoribosylaminopyrimidine deaminase/5-amino-6-(5-phosphoribosylamino)uracil reductase
VRVTLDRHGVIPADSRLYSADAPTIVYRENTNWEFILEDLASKNIHSILVEGGATILNHIIQSGIYDEVHVEVSDKVIGSGIIAPNYLFKSTPKIVDNHLIYIESQL